MRLRLPRYDFRGGVNRSFTEDAKDVLEVTLAQNCRLGKVYGSLTKLEGSQRIHTDQLESGAVVTGVFQWDHATAKLVAICNGDLYHKTLAATTWTRVAGTTLSATRRAIFQQHVIAGSPTLYFADGALRKWNGSILTESIVDAPSALFIAYYKGRMFAVDGTKTLYWSAVADPEDWAVGGDNGPVGVNDAEGLIGLCPAGPSLLLFKEDSIARFTGVDTADIRIDVETEGLSPEIGCVAPGTICRVEDFCVFLSKMGPYMATGAGIQPIGVKVESDFRALAESYRSLAWTVHLKRRHEVLWFVPASGQTTNATFWIWNYRTDSWTGPHFFEGFAASVAAPYELSTSRDSVLVGGYDGRFRDVDVDGLGKDDVLLNGTGGTAITMKVTLPELLFGAPGVLKRLHATQVLRANLGASGSLSVICDSEIQSEDTLTITTTGNAVDTYEFRPYLQGTQPVMSLQEATANVIQLNGLELVAELGRTP